MRNNHFQTDGAWVGEQGVDLHPAFLHRRNGSLNPVAPNLRENHFSTRTRNLGTTREAPAFGQRMASIRQQRGLTQVQFAERMDTTQKMIDYYERRSPNPALDVMQKIAAALEANMTELL